MRKKIAVVGGDKRAIYASLELTKAGIHCSLFGLEEDPQGNCGGFEAKNCLAPYLLSEAISGADALLLPVPVTKDGKTVLAPLSSKKIALEELFSVLPGDCTVFGGNIPPELPNGRQAVDFLKDENFALDNALPTAENALGLAILHYEGLLSGSRAAVIGYGRIGRVLCRRLTALGARVTVFARRDESRRQARLSGVEALSIEDLPSRLNVTDIFFNTVPFRIFGKDHILDIRPDALYVELASPPYGMEEENRKILRAKYLLASGLPGKYSPRYAGKLIADVILRTP